MYNKDKIIKASIIVGFVLLFLLSMPFFIIENPEKYRNNDVLKSEEQRDSQIAQQQMPMPQQTFSPMPQTQTTNSAYAKMHNSGIQYYAQHDYMNAMAMFKEALRLSPGNKLDTYYLGLCESKMHDYPNAESKFASVETAYAHKKEYWLARALNAKNLQQDEFLEKAQTYIQEAHELDSSDLQVLFHRAQIMKAAYNSYKRAYNVQDGNPTLDNPKNILLNAYQDLYSAAKMQGNEQYAELSSEAIARIQSYSHVQNMMQQTTTPSAEIQVQNQNINQNHNLQQNTQSQQNTGVHPADIQLIENLPVME